MKIGFIGLGLMGRPMAKNILKKGFELVVYNRTAERTQEFQQLGATVGRSPKEVAEKSDVVISMVTAPEDVKEVMLGEDGVINSNKKGLIAIDMSTIGPTAAREIGKALESCGIEFLDAPVTGSTPKAITGELTIFIGGKLEVFEKAKPVLLAMGTNLQYMGESGNGQAIKLINNLIIAISTEAVAEGMLLADAMGLPREAAARVLKTIPGMSPMMILKLPDYVSGKFTKLFSTANMTKDLRLALGEAKKGNKTLPTLEKVESEFEQAMIGGLAQEDFASVIKILEKPHDNS